MAYSTQSAVSDGTLSVLPLSIDYLSRDDITVYLGSAQAVKDVAWSWVGTIDRSIKFTPAVPKDVVVTVKRSTGVTGLYHKFSGGAQFTSKTLDESLTQTLFVAQEFSESSSVASDDLPLPVGSQASAGKSNKYARTDHVHVGMTGGAVGSVVMDTFTGDGVKLAFALQNTPTTKGATQVFVDSVYQSKQVYSLAANTLTFDEAPASGAVIEIITVTIGGGRASDIQLNETPEMLATDTGGNVQGALQWIAKWKKDLIKSVGASLVGFVQSGVGAVLRTVQDKLREQVSVLDFGADPTGVLDCSGAIAAAIEAIHQKAKQTTVVGPLSHVAILYFPPGTYLVSKKVLVSANTTLRGDGATIMCRNDGPTFETAYYGDDGKLVSNMALDDTAVTYHALPGVRFENLTFSGGDMPLNLRCAVWNSAITDCQFYDCHIAWTATQCFYSTYRNITVRGQNAAFPSAHGIRLMRASNAITLDNISVSYRDYGITIGEGGDINISGSLNLYNLRLEVLLRGIELGGGFYNLNIHDVYAESVDSLFVDYDGAMKYNVTIDRVFSNSTTYYVDMSGMRDCYIGALRDHSSMYAVKGVVRLRQGTFGNTGTVEMSNFTEATTGTNRYQLSNGVMTKGVLSKYTSGTASVFLNQNAVTNITVSQYANQTAIFDGGWYGETPGYIIGTTDGVLHPVNGTEPYVITRMFWSEHNAFSYSIKITPNAGSGVSGATPAPVYLKGIVMGSHTTQVVPNGLVAYSFRNSGTGTAQLAFGEFGVNNTDPAFAWMRNGLFTAEGIIKLIA